MNFKPIPISLFLCLLFPVASGAADWPMWRFDPGRTGTSPQILPENLTVHWVRDLPTPKPAFRDARLQFDAGYEPVIMGKRLFIASSFDDSLTAFSTETGEQLWKFFADGPIRFAPVADTSNVIFGADDGWIYCVSTSQGHLVWKHRAVPSGRQLLGNGRLISVWPVRGGPVLKDGRVYLAAGVWPMEGVFIYCLDATTGKVIWLNDRTGYLYGQHPHNAEAFGGLAPQGYLVIDGEDLVVPCSAAYPARLDLATGTLKDFQLPAPGRLPGGWFASTPSEIEAQKLKRRGLLFDDAVNAVRHEDKPRAEGLPEIRSTIFAGERELKFAAGFPGVEGTVHSLAVAGGKLFIVTREGRLYALGESTGAAPRHWGKPPASSAPAADSMAAVEILKTAGARHGYAVVIGLEDKDLAFLPTLVAQSELRVVALDSRPERIAAERLASRLPGERLSFRAAEPANIELPPYFASLIIVRQPISKEQLVSLYASLRPFGGALVGPADLVEMAEAANLPGAKVSKNASGRTFVTRAGAPPGSTNYTGGWTQSPDELVKAPLGVLWFDDSVGNFKRAPQPLFVDGVMITTSKDWLDASTRTGKVDYRLLSPVFSDVYTGRVMAADEALVQRQSFGRVDQVTIQPSQYRPPTQKEDWKPEPPQAGTRVNPLTGQEEPRTFPKSYGCDGGFDYGLVYTMRSGTAAFYDKRIESGTINISGPRSGCTNSLIPANGLLNVPYYYEGCTCSYPLPMALALIHQPPYFEQWTAWGDVPGEELAGKIQRIGLNFGAPGDRMAEDGTLWLDMPNSGGPSPQVEVSTMPPLNELQSFYRHSLWMEGGDGWPWVAASGIRGVSEVTLTGLAPGTYTVRLVFGTVDAQPAKFDVSIQGNTTLTGFDPLAEAGGPMRIITKATDGVAVNGRLTIELRAAPGRTFLSGMEVVRNVEK